MPFKHLPELELRLYYELHGDPASAKVLVISGSGGDLRHSRPGSSPLNQSGYCCHYDQRGLGQSDKPAGPYTMADYADDAAALARALGWPRCHVVGTSFGGMVALHLAVRHPSLVDRLVLACTSPGGAFASFPLETLSGLPAETRRERVLSLFDSRYDRDAEQPFPDLSRRAFETYTAGLTIERQGPALDGYLCQLAARQRHDVTGALALIRQPTLICAGAFDRVAPLSNSRFMADHMPDATLQIFEGGHLFMMQDRRAFPRIGHFLSAQERSSVAAASTPVRAAARRGGG